MKKRSFLKQVLDIGVGTMLTVIIGVITTPIITRLVEPQMYGRFALFNTYLTLGLSFICLGLDQAFLRFFYELGNEKERYVLFRWCIKIPLIIWGSILVGALLSMVCRISFIKDNWLMDILYIISLGLVVINRFSMNCLRVENESRLYAMLNCMTKVLYVLGVIFLINITTVSHIYILILANLIAYVIPTGVAIVREKNFWNDFASRNTKINFKHIELIKYGMPLMVSTSVFSLFQAVDRISLNYFCDKATVGVYASAQTLMTAFSIIQQSFNIVWGAKSIEKYESKDDNKDGYYRKVFEIIVFLMFAFGATMLVAKSIFVLLLGKDYRESVKIIPFLMLNPIMYTISETTNIGLVMKKKSMYQVYIVGICCIINILGNTLLIPLVGAKGAAISTGISYIIFFFLRTFFSNKFLPLGFNIKKIVIVISLFVVMALFHSYNENMELESIIIFFVFMVILVTLYKKSFLSILSTVHNFRQNNKGGKANEKDINDRIL